MWHLMHTLFKFLRHLLQFASMFVKLSRISLNRSLTLAGPFLCVWDKNFPLRVNLSEQVLPFVKLVHSRTTQSLRECIGRFAKQNAFRMDQNNAISGNEAYGDSRRGTS